MIRFQCPNCNTILQIGKEYAGQPVLCSSCNTQLIVPQTPAPEPTLNKADPKTIICICGQCKSTYKVPAAAAGRQIPCPKCGHTALIPEDQQVVTESNTMRFSCPTCRQSYCVLAKYAGRKFDCRACRRPCIIPQPRRPAEELPMLEPDDTPEEENAPVPTPGAGPDLGLSFKLQADEEIGQSDELTLLPPQETHTAPPPPPPQVPESASLGGKTEKSSPRPSKSRIKIAAGIIAGLVGFVVGFLVVYNLVKPDDSQTDPDMPAAAQQTAVPQTPDAIRFAESVVRRLHRNAADLSDLKYEFPDDIYVTDAEVQSLAGALNIGSLDTIQSVVEVSREEFSASHYLVRTLAASSDGQTREVQIGFFNILETDEDTFQSESFNWLIGITVMDENGILLASAGLHDSDTLIARMNELVDEHGAGFSEEQVRGIGRLFAALAPYMCMLIILFLIARLIMIICQVAVLINNGEPGWAIFVPMYRQVVLARVADKDEWMGWLCGFAEVNLMFTDVFGFLPVVFLLASPFIYLIFTFIFALGIAKAHGKGIGFGLGLFFLPIIFYPILAFSGKAYD